MTESAIPSTIKESIESVNPLFRSEFSIHKHVNTKFLESDKFMPKQFFAKELA